MMNNLNGTGRAGVVIWPSASGRVEKALEERLNSRGGSGGGVRRRKSLYFRNSFFEHGEGRCRRAVR